MVASQSLLCDDSFEEIIFEKADKEIYMRKRECDILRFSKEMSTDFLNSQSVHFTIVILKYSVKKKKHMHYQ